LRGRTPGRQQANDEQSSASYEQSTHGRSMA
jgi:hypothetical protein